ncbi:MAG: hypothetical protein IT560_06575 [Alphaproteobacteria bacterium]|nr:hypothetical protein [Alphaproteobacteria bacterium]
MQSEFEAIIIENVEAPLENAVQYREFGRIAKRVGGAIIALAMLAALPSFETNKVIADNVSIASLSCSPASSFLRKTVCEMPGLDASTSKIISEVIKTQ